MHTKEFSALNDFSQDVVDLAHELVALSSGCDAIDDHMDGERARCLLCGEAPAVTALINDMRNKFVRRYFPAIVAECHKIEAARTAVAAAEPSHV